MDHRVTVMVIIVFGGVIAFTFFTATLYTSVGPEVAAAAAGGTGGAGAEPEPPSPREQLLHLLAVLDRRAADWEREHRGRRPDFNTYPGWQQFLEKTGLTGRPNPDGSFGPYIPSPPVNPLNQLSTAITVDKPLRAADPVPAPEGARVGFVYSTADHCFWGTNGAGRVILTRAPAQHTQADAR